MTSMPSRSQASRNAGDGGLWLVRMALKPFAFINSTRRSSARSIAADPSTPLAWCMQPPLSFTTAPLIRRPRWASTSMVRTPNVASAWSTTAWPATTSTSARYRFGAAGDQSAGDATSSVTSASVVPAAPTVTAARPWAAAAPAGPTRRTRTSTGWASPP